MPEVKLVSVSQASDLGYRALTDLAEAATGLRYRVIGGHMVGLLLHLFPTQEAALRGTADADAGVEIPVAAGLDLHRGLMERGYQGIEGNRYRNGEKFVDLLVPEEGHEAAPLIGERRFDAVPGLHLVLNSEALDVNATAYLTDGDEISFHVPVPNVECAVVLKTLVRRKRLVPKDLTDLASLLEVAFAYRDSIPWSLNSPNLKGARRDTVVELNRLVEQLDKRQGQFEAAGIRPERVAALVRSLVGAS